MSDIKSTAKLIGEGNEAYKKGDYHSAVLSFAAACREFAAVNDQYKVAEMANNCSVAYLQLGQPQKALEVLEGAAEIFEIKGDLKSQGMTYGNQAAALEALNRLEEAERLYKQSAELLKQAGADQLRLEVMKSLSNLQLNMGRRLEALATMQSGVEDIEHPNPKQFLLKRLLKIPFELMNKS
jgi:tetratricopeptide (TPR) repeat protein